MSIPEVNPVPGIWPLGVITVTGGTPKQIIANVGSQDAGKNDAGVKVVMPQGRNFGSSCGQLVFSAPSANSGDVFINDGNFAGTPETNRTVLCIPKGMTLSLPAGAELQSGVIDVTRYWVDGTTGDKIIVTAMDAS